MFHYVLFGLCKFQTVGSAEIYKNPMIVWLGQTMFFLKNAYSKVKDKGTHETKAHMARAYPGFHYFPLDASPSRGYPSAVCRRYPFIHLGEERQSGVKLLVQGNNGWLEPRTSRSGLQGVNRSATRLHKQCFSWKTLTVKLANLLQ